jgi:hypothetical protein
MQDRWTGKNIDLTLLSKYVEKFFKEMGYKAKKNELMRGYKIFVIPRNTRDVVARIEIRVLGQHAFFNCVGVLNNTLFWRFNSSTELEIARSVGEIGKGVLDLSG